ncbi:hypothetical protein FOZ62_011113, partial [Perkinsus olseni]
QSTANGGIIISFWGLKELVVTEEDGRYIAKLGVADLASGGGRGLLSARYGLSADRVIAAEVVVYDREEGKFELVTATGYNEHLDLLFAVRGGMGGNYGALVSLSYDTFPVTNVVVISGKNSDCMMHSDAAGPEIFGIGKFLGGGGIQYCIVNTVRSVFATPLVIAQLAKLDALEAVVGLPHPLRIEQDFGKAMWFWADCTGHPGVDFYPPEGIASCSEEELKEAMDKCLYFDRDVNGGPNKAKSIYFPEDMCVQELRTLAEAAVDPVCQSPSDCAILLDFCGHAMVREPDDCNQSAGKCTSFDHRAPGWHMQILVFWEKDKATPIEKLEWLRETYESAFPGSLGTAYQNYIDSDLADGREWIGQYFPNAGTYPRLQQVKCRYNAIDMFNFEAVDLMTINIDDSISRAGTG